MSQYLDTRSILDIFVKNNIKTNTVPVEENDKRSYSHDTGFKEVEDVPFLTLSFCGICVKYFLG